MRIKGVVVLTIAFLVAGAVGVKFVGLPIHLRGPVPDRTIEIGIETTAMTASGLAVQNGAEFAIIRAGSVRGFYIKFVVHDDSAHGAYDPDSGAMNVEAMLADSRLLGVVGPVFSPVARAMIPIANNAHLAIISPTTSVACLTLFSESCPEAWSYTALRPTGKNNYFRIAAAESFRGAAMADFAYDALALRRVAVWSDQELWGWGTAEADGFSSEFTRKGGLVVTRKYVDFSLGDPSDTLSAIQSDFHAWLIQARDARAEAVYSGAPSSWAGCEQWASLSQGVFDSDTYYLGSDAGPDPTASGGDPQQGRCIADAHALATGRVYASSDIADARLNPGAASIIAAYRRAHPDGEYDPNTFAGYDCAAILIAAIRRAIDANHGRLPTRQQVVDQLASTRNFHGLTGSYSFSANGDPTSPTVAISQFRQGAWTPAYNVTAGS